MYKLSRDSRRTVPGDPSQRPYIATRCTEVQYSISETKGMRTGTFRALQAVPFNLIGTAGLESPQKQEGAVSPRRMH
jgi:hypothetical protein